MKQAKEFIGYAVIAAICGLAISIILVNFLIGCGETFYNADGSWETGSCFLVPYEPARSQ